MRFIELFAGIGGFRYGLEATSIQKNFRSKDDTEEEYAEGQGLQSIQSKTNRDQRGQFSKYTDREFNERQFTCVWSNEWDKYASQIYRKHYGEIYEGDIRSVDVDAIPEHDLICAGFPCQSFSIAGKRRGFEDTRGTLFFEICRIARVKRAPYLWLENVKGLLSHDEGKTFQTIIQSLDELGYDCQWQVLNSKDFDIPQNRERVFIIGHLRGLSRPKVFPVGEASQTSDRDGNICAPTLHTAYGQQRGGAFIKRTQFDVSGKGYKSQQDRVYDTSEVMAAIPAGRTENKVNIFAENSIRRLTPTECERLQGFPDGWTEYGLTEDFYAEKMSDTQRYKCLGNAVTTDVITAIGEQLIKEI